MGTTPKFIALVREVCSAADKHGGIHARATAGRDLQEEIALTP